MVAATVMSYSATASGLMAALIAVGGFVAHARPALRGVSEKELREATIVGGAGGVVAALGVIVLSALVS